MSKKSFSPLSRCWPGFAAGSCTTTVTRGGDQAQRLPLLRSRLARREKSPR
jgi:hypothetical protein